MTEETDHDRVIRLETKLEDAEKALQLAYANTHGIRAEVISVISLALAAYAVFHK